MTRRNFGIVFFAVIVSFPLFGDSYSITPASGPTNGGTEVTIKGDFALTDFKVFFGGEQATNVRRVDEHTLLAVTPPHLPGPSAVGIFAHDHFVVANITYRFLGDIPTSFERVLLPLFLPPIHGQFNSEFVTSFTARYTGTESAYVYGLQYICILSACIDPQLNDSAWILTTTEPRIDDSLQIERNGNPGRFLYIPKRDAADVAMNLRVFDRSRTAANHGTEIPIVPFSRFVETNEPLTLLNVPLDPRFRNTLRIYGANTAFVVVTIEGPNGLTMEHELTLSPSTNIFEPAFATFSDFPTGTGTVDVTLRIAYPIIDPVPQSNLWAFVSVTNNDTQLITTITPQTVRN